LGDKKSGVDPLSAAPAASGASTGSRSGNCTKGSNLRALAAARFLGEVVPYVRELIRELVPEKDHRDDDRDRNNGDDECVFDQALP
jgi:hypothetical protein